MKLPLKALGLLLISATLIASCSKDSKPDNEQLDVITLNMLDETNGKTILGTTDIYINKSNNFYASSTLIADAGYVDGIGVPLAPKLGNLAKEVAVVPGHLYQFFDLATVRDFSSGVRAMQVGAPYYKVFVVSTITNNDKHRGAVVEYAVKYPDPKGLPDIDYELGTVQRYGESVSMQLPDGAECSWGDDVKRMFDISTSGGVLKMTLNQYNWIAGVYKGVIRVGEVYTEVTLRVR